jgi:hypothetical protein
MILELMSLFTGLKPLKASLVMQALRESSPTGYQLQNKLDNFSISVTFRLNGVATGSQSGCRNRKVKGQDSCPAATVAWNLGRE